MTPVFLINLDEDTEKLVRMDEQLSGLGWKWERIRAFKGTNLEPGFILRENQRTYFRMLTPGEIGCLLSHVTIWRRMVEDQIEVGLVLEDDVVIAQGIASLIQDTSWLPGNDCIVRLETFCMKVVMGDQAGIVHDMKLYPLQSVHHGSAAYLITRARARKMLELYENCVDEADSLLFRYPRRTSVYQLAPAPCVQRNIYENGFCYNGAHSMLHQERLAIERQSRLQLPYLARQILWKLGSIANICLDVIKGYKYQSVPFLD